MSPLKRVYVEWEGIMVIDRGWGKHKRRDVMEDIEKLTYSKDHT